MPGRGCGLSSDAGDLSARPVRELRSHAARDRRALRRRLRAPPRASAGAASRPRSTSTTRTTRRARSSRPTSPASTSQDVALEIRGRQLLIAGERRPAEAGGRLYQQIEIEHGPFRRVVELGPTWWRTRPAPLRGRRARVEIPLAPPTSGAAGADRRRRASEHPHPIGRRRGRGGRRPGDAPGGAARASAARQRPVPRDADAARGRPGALDQARERRARRQPDARHGRGEGPRGRGARAGRPLPRGRGRRGGADAQGARRHAAHPRPRRRSESSSATSWPPQPYLVARIDRGARRGRAVARARGARTATCRPPSRESSRSCPTCRRSSRSRSPTSTTPPSSRT